MTTRMETRLRRWTRDSDNSPNVVGYVAVLLLCLSGAFTPAGIVSIDTAGLTARNGGAQVLDFVSSAADRVHQVRSAHLGEACWNCGCLHSINVVTPLTAQGARLTSFGCTAKDTGDFSALADDWLRRSKKEPT